MKNKIQEVQEYFRRKIVGGKYDVVKLEQYQWTIKVDDYEFILWVGNGAEYVDVRGFMKFKLNEADQKTVWLQVEAREKENLRKVIEYKTNELEELKNKLS